MPHELNALRLSFMLSLNEISLASFFLADLFFKDLRTCYTDSGHIQNLHMLMHSSFGNNIKVMLLGTPRPVFFLLPF